MFVCVLRRVFILVTRFSGCVGDESTARAGDSPCVAWAETSYSTSSAPQQSVLPRALELCTDVSQGHSKAATLDNTGAGSQPTQSCLHSSHLVTRAPGITWLHVTSQRWWATYHGGGETSDHLHCWNKDRTLAGIHVVTKHDEWFQRSLSLL